ncbi:hypothetical protein HS088_TW20G00496 [Tripterygium wilfordii]|uniref:Uncharacterized protein n=1 Tax=Tripterygium wilfordii TaxID=458696 RepID=A0A7J7C8P8_TRIWF|nr:hypothetical protein HS088_TW20G00496 [Tripterygium wilfordii]
MGKKTSLQSPNHLTGAAGIRWATQSSGRREIVVNKKRDGRLHSKAYAMADVLRTSIYCMVSVFHEEMLTSAKGSNIGKNWIISRRSKPPFGPVSCSYKNCYISWISELVNFPAQAHITCPQFCFHLANSSLM